MSHDEEVKLLVLILTNFESRPCDPNVKQLEHLFSNPHFLVKKVNVEQIPPKQKKSVLTELQWSENYRMRKALDFAAKRSADLPVLVVKDSSVSDLHPDAMWKRISTALQHETDFHFLTVWGDFCATSHMVNRENRLIETRHPNSCQAVIYSPDARDLIRSKLIDSRLPLPVLLNTHVDGTYPGLKEPLRATAFNPNIVHFDVSLSTSIQDYHKLNHCAGPNSEDPSKSNVNSMIWFLIIVGLMLVVSYCLIILS